MKVSDCCCVGPANDSGICPACREHCEFVEEDREDATQELRAVGKDAAHKLAAHIHETKAAKATIPVTVNGVEYVVTVEVRSDFTSEPY
jgi:hypothetical protein